jgi:hypothetical protein
VQTEAGQHLGSDNRWSVQLTSTRVRKHGVPRGRRWIATSITAAPSTTTARFSLLCVSQSTIACRVARPEEVVAQRHSAAVM